MILSVVLPEHLAQLVQAGPTTTLPSAEITITGSNVTTSSQVPGAHQDPADLYGIVLVFVGIAVALFGSRWLFGRRGPHPYRPSPGDPPEGGIRS